MGAGLFIRGDALTCYCEPYDGLPDYDDSLHYLWAAQFEYVRDICMDEAGATFERTDRWGPNKDHVFLENGLFEISTYEDDYGRVHISFAVNAKVEGQPAANLAYGRLDSCAKAFFDRVQVYLELRVRTCAWTSAPRDQGGRHAV